MDEDAVVSERRQSHRDRAGCAAVGVACLALAGITALVVAADLAADLQEGGMVATGAATVLQIAVAPTLAIVGLSLLVSACLRAIDSRTVRAAAAIVALLDLGALIAILVWSACR